MAQGVPIRFGLCDGGPWHKKHLAHHEDMMVIPIDRLTKKVVPGIQRVKAAEREYMFGEYRFDGKVWQWTPPDAA